MIASYLEGFPPWTVYAIAVLVALAAAFLVAEVASRALRRLLVRAGGTVPPSAAGAAPAAPAGPSSDPRSRASVRLVRLVVFLLAAGIFIFPALHAAGVQTDVGLSPEALGRWAARSGLRVGLILLLAWLVVHVVGLVAARLEEGVADGASVDAIERSKRARTIGKLVQNTVFVLVSVIATLMVLREFAIDITPILTGAGIVGLAVGFGAQTLVKDIISGFFIILENQVRVGDVANIDGTGGLVERITLRTIILRDLAGTVHVVPNGSIQRLANLTKDFSYYVVDVRVSYRDDTDAIVDVLREVADGMLQEPAYAVSMLGPLEVIGVDRLGESWVEVKVRLKTVPLKQWEVGREFLRRVKKAYDAKGLQMPFPHQAIVLPQGLALASPGVDPSSAGPRQSPPAGSTPPA